MAGMKIAISGKGGVGKTTIASLLALIFSKQNHKVLAIDCDPNLNLGTYLGIKEDIIPIIKMRSLIEERMGIKLDTVGTFFKLNPKVDDLPDKFYKSINGMKVISIGTIKKAGTGCACPENTFIKSLVSHLVLDRDEVIIMDMPAGLEHFGRGTAASVNVLMVVVEPSMASLKTTNKIKELANDLKIKNTFIVVNKLRNDTDEKFIEKYFDKDEILSKLFLEEEILDCSLTGNFPVKLGNENFKSFKEMVEKIWHTL